MSPKVPVNFPLGQSIPAHAEAAPEVPAVPAAKPPSRATGMRGRIET